MRPYTCTFRDIQVKHSTLINFTGNDDDDDGGGGGTYDTRAVDFIQRDI
jgi:hypothetical protein